MALKKLGHVVLKVRDLDRSERFYTHVVGFRVTGTYERPRAAWPADSNPFAGRSPLPFQPARDTSR